MSLKTRTQIAAILNNEFKETFTPEDIHQSRLFKPEYHTDNTIRWYAKAQSGALVSSIGMTMSEFIKQENAGKIKKAFHKDLGWQYRLSA